MTDEGDITVLKEDEIKFAYRYSSFQEASGAIVAAAFQLQPSETARQRQLEIIRYRQSTQPYSEKSAGCIFRNPGVKPAGALIDQAGLKGLNVGGAKVPPMHANFIVADDQATAKDVLALIELIRHKVKEVQVWNWRARCAIFLMSEFKADLHCHTNCSDGSVSPEEIISLAIKAGLSGLSITDHDSIHAYPRALPIAKSLSFPLISGVEFSAMHKGESVHILGYSFSLNSSAIAEFCLQHLRRRTLRTELS